MDCTSLGLACCNFAPVRPEINVLCTPGGNGPVFTIFFFSSSGTRTARFSRHFARAPAQRSAQVRVADCSAREKGDDGIIAISPAALPCAAAETMTARAFPGKARGSLDALFREPLACRGTAQLTAAAFV